MAPRPPARDEPDLDLLEYVLISAPSVSALAPAGSAAAALVARGSIRILDAVVLVRRRARPQVAVADVSEHEELQSLAAVLSTTMLLSTHDTELAALTLAPDEAALLLLLEHRWAGSLSAAARAAGGRLDAGERIQRDRVMDALTAHQGHQPAVRAESIDLLVRGPGDVPAVDRAEQVRELAGLVDRGVLSVELYEVQRRRLLES
ncbi:hypothetical protein [Nocardioides mangrovi]|uniref:Uncharacterized protein n=1 Tax=Nocardioides mangrovi TaxID=2874580 RepID=A0ABS7U8C7_9ACTN|nr:hypothetical protein [Nocardioides mangrovi]MBZ5737107.1 hypothetical protein [Nocardioides mangrovi]